MERFEAILVRTEGVGTWTYLAVPFDAFKRFGVRSRIQVKGTIDGHPYKSTLLPSGEGGHLLVIKKQIRDAIGKASGDRVEVTVEKDSSPRFVAVPEDLRRSLDVDAKAKEAFGRMAYSHQKAYVEWIGQAKRPETRERRVKKAVQMISKGLSAR